MIEVGEEGHFLGVVAQVARLEDHLLVRLQHPIIVNFAGKRVAKACS